MKKLIFSLIAFAVVGLGFANAQSCTGKKTSLTSNKKACSAKKVAEMPQDGNTIFRTASLENEGYDVSKCAASGSVTASKTCAASGKTTTVKTCGTSGKTTKKVVSADGMLLSEEIIAGEATEKNAATTDEGAFMMTDLETDGFAMSKCASSGSLSASKTCAASGKLTKYKQCGTSGKVTKTVKSADGVVLSSEIVSNGKAAEVAPIKTAAAKKACCKGKSKCGSGNKAKAASAE